MDVILSTNAARIAESLRSEIDGSNDIFLGFPLRLGCTRGAQRLCREHSACPGPKVLRGYVSARDVLQICIYVLRLDSLSLSIVIQIFEELFAAQLLTALDNARDPSIGHRYR